MPSWKGGGALWLIDFSLQQLVCCTILTHDGLAGDSRERGSTQYEVRRGSVSHEF